MMSRWFLLSLTIVALENSHTVSSFVVAPAPSTYSLTQPITVLHAQEQPCYDPEEEVKRRLARAKEVLAKSKAKLENKDDESDDSKAAEASKSKAEAAVPFFAAKNVAKDPQRREKVIKFKDDKTGLVTADGEKMAAMSENEKWEKRSLLEVFDNEIEDDADVYSAASQQLAERDVAASIWNLRKVMKTEDYLKIFDKKNFLIGEDN